MTFKSLAVSAAALWLAAAPAASAQSAGTVELGVGETKSLDVKELAESVSLSRAGVVTVDKGASKQIVVLTGRAPGQADLSVRLASGTVLSYLVNVSDPAAFGRQVESIR